MDLNAAFFGPSFGMEGGIEGAIFEACDLCFGSAEARRGGRTLKCIRYSGVPAEPTISEEKAEKNRTSAAPCLKSQQPIIMGYFQ